MNTLLEELKTLGLAITIDGYEEPKKVFNHFEAKYDISSLDFYNYYYGLTSTSLNISPNDAAEWIFNCNCFISCDGNLKDLVPISNNIDLCQSTLINEYCYIKKEEKRKSPLFLFWFAQYIMNSKILRKHISFYCRRNNNCSISRY